MSRVAVRSQDARTTAGDVKTLAEALASEAESLDHEVRHFLDEVRAAWGAVTNFHGSSEE